jgi:HEPN domain-containing protein
MNPQLDQARELLSAAQRDRLTLRILLRDSESPVESMLFHAQQALEKALKAVVVAHGIVFRRTHDLIELLDMAATHGIVVPAPRDLLLRLAPYAVEFRYLGVKAPEVSPREAETGVEAVMEWAAREIEAT